MAKAKNVSKKKDKVIADKTFGLKNKKKSKKVQEFVKQVEKTVKYSGGKNARIMQKEIDERQALKAKKKEMEMMDLQMKSLFRTVGSTSRTVVPPGADPKSVVCQFFRDGLCKKGKKCKFSHDLGVERKVSKIDLYADPRQQDTIDSWDQNKLEEVVGEKEGKPSNETKIVCKYFLDAIEKHQYGWFWNCPNGKTCIYKHCLPPGFIFQPKSSNLEDHLVEEVDIGEEIEEERKKLNLLQCTPVTIETFNKWKEERKLKQVEELKEQVKEASKKSSSRNKILSGRALFTFDPTLFVDDEGAADDDEYDIKDDDDDEPRDSEDYTETVNDADLFLDEDVELPSDED